MHYRAGDKFAFLAILIALGSCQKTSDARNDHVSDASPSTQASAPDTTVRIAFVEDSSLMISGIRVGAQASDVQRILGAPSRAAEPDSLLDDYR